MKTTSETIRRESTSTCSRCKQMCASNVDICNECVRDEDNEPANRTGYYPHNSSQLSSDNVPNEWTCSGCTYTNFSYNPLCTVCKQGKRPIQPYKHNLTDSSSSASSSTPISKHITSIDSDDQRESQNDMYDDNADNKYRHGSKLNIDDRMRTGRICYYTLIHRYLIYLVVSIIFYIILMYSFFSIVNRFA
jgi:hypothetical protein